MKKLLGIVVLGLILVGNAYSETKFSEIKKALKEDSYGLAIPQSFHALNSPKATTEARDSTRCMPQSLLRLEQLDYSKQRQES